MVRRLALTLTAVALAVTGVPAVAGGPPHSSSGSTPAARYDVTITRTEYGIPHILAKDFGSLGYGYGYAFAQDNLCTMAADYITVEGRRSRGVGPDASYTRQGNGVTVTNLDSDFFWTQVRQSHQVDELLSRPAPIGPKPAV